VLGWKRRWIKHKLATEANRLRVERDDAKNQLERIGAMGRDLVVEVKRLRAELERLGALSILQLEAKRKQLDAEIRNQASLFAQQQAEVTNALDMERKKLDEARKAIVETEETALLQEIGVYKYRHPLTDAIAYERELSKIDDQIKAMTMKDGGAVQSATSWTVNGSAAQGKAMVREISKLMLRAFNAEADNLVRGLKPYKLDSALDRLKKVSETIAKLGQTMSIQIAHSYYLLRVHELELTADFLQKQAEEKEVERLGREKLREERKAQQEITAERERLEKEHQHYTNALDALVKNGDEEAASRIREQLADVKKAIEHVDYRAANIRAGYVYVISNIGSFGENMIKVGMTRRLEPEDRIRELSDASVPFNFDTHALFFSNDAVGIESAMHDRLASARVNTVNPRREFFHITPLEAKAHLRALSGELLEFTEVAEALEYRQSIQARNNNRQPALAG
jgi:hypothetical protein